MRTMNKWEGKKSHKMTEEEKQYILEMHEDHLTPRNIARYLGYSETTIINLLTPGKRRASQKKWISKNKEKLQKQTLEYSKVYVKKVNKRCLDCDKLISPHSKRCRSCGAVEWNKRKK